MKNTCGNLEFMTYAKSTRLLLPKELLAAFVCMYVCMNECMYVCMYVLFLVQTRVPFCKNAFEVMKFT
jgi:hypothetical protein